MQSTKYIIWEEAGQWLGYLQDHPDHVAQGTSFEDLQSKLRHLRHDLANQEHGQSLPIAAPPKLLTTRQFKTRRRLEKIFWTMLSTR